MTGGKLVYGSNHYKDLNSLWNEAISDFSNQEPAAEDSSAGDSTEGAPAESKDTGNENALDDKTELVL